MSESGRSSSAQDNLEPDRPDVTNGTHIVDVGLLQIEVGGSGAEPLVGTLSELPRHFASVCRIGSRPASAATDFSG